VTTEEFLDVINPMVWYFARRIARGYRRLRVDAEDLYQEGILAAFQIAASYDPAEAKPVTFAQQRVRGAMIDFIRTKADELGRRHCREVGRGEVRMTVSTTGQVWADGVLQCSGPEVADDRAAEFRAAVRGLNAGLVPSELDTLTDYYVSDRLMKDIASARGLSESRVSQWHAQMIEKLRAAAAEQGWTELTAFAR